eukprot:2037298-Prymnesium_polylepis.2
MSNFSLVQSVCPCGKFDRDAALVNRLQLEKTAIRFESRRQYVRHDWLGISPSQRLALPAVDFDVTHADQQKATIHIR